MDTSTKLANEMMTDAEKFYHELLAKQGYEDTKIVRAGFYMAVKDAMEADPLPDTLAQELVLEKLETLISVAIVNAQDELTINHKD